MDTLVIGALDELVKLTGIPLLPLLGCLAAVLFLAFGSFLSLTIGTRQMFVFGVAPVGGGVLLRIFPVYFIFVGLAIGVCIAFISFPRSVSYKDRVRVAEVEMQLESLGYRIEKEE